ncbi:hypothetical protein EHQ12_03960 [Leptospira gomenensis]|uniref:Uncharacterized protein n=1 Tax=Leptospira gomenensis TaxID=2484974 RepID=A0A5F1YGW7_9LEPT|nr:hypothetical protein [Leptospira gomenensis]TGK36170.1 hypothetical protein EHQ17_04445 [Leptospira gomenensis]TGK42790.1 hypothetical protein EHQ07_14045 [Leptospira gomenensis]TGK42922.1 hypothetical protein EHQ12_03960 [Leptospira gomenensis]TGK54934.1 hypothetical protein EHQ13_18215 [Leptospira gomenensis]
MQKFLINAEIQIQRPVYDNDNNIVPGTDKPYPVKVNLQASSKILIGKDGGETKASYFILVAEEELPAALPATENKGWEVKLPGETDWFQVHDVKPPAGRYLRNVQFYVA